MDTLKKTAVIIEDETINTEILTKMLSRYPEIEIIGKAESRKQARELLLTCKPDVLFLDIMLPDGSGFDLLPYVDEKTHIIFTTSHGVYAVQAFEINAVDYLLKPFSHDRLSMAIKRIESKSSPYKTTEKTIKNGALKVNKNKLIIKNQLVDYSAILSISSIGGNYTSVTYSEQKPVILRKTLKEWEAVLSTEKFIRIHRSRIINSEKIKHLSNESGNYVVFIDGLDAPLQISRRHVQEIKKVMKESGRSV